MQSVGIKNGTLSLQILQSIHQIELYTQQLAQVEASIHEVMNRLNSVIKTVPGIGDLNGAMIIGEIGDISRFEKPCPLFAYAGLNPQSTNRATSMLPEHAYLNEVLNSSDMLLSMLHGRSL